MPSFSIVQVELTDKVNVQPVWAVKVAPLALVNEAADAASLKVQPVAVKLPDWLVKAAFD